VLAAEIELDAPARGDAHMVVAQGGEAEGLVLLGVFGVADARQAALHQPHHRRQHLLARQAVSVQIGLDTPARARQRAAEAQHMLELGLVAHMAPARMIAVLLAPARVAPGRLDMAVGVGADPHRRPGGRHGERADARERGGIADQQPLRIAIEEAVLAVTDPLARDAGRVVADTVKARGLGRDQRIDGGRLGEGGRRSRGGRGRRLRDARCRMRDHGRAQLR